MREDTMELLYFGEIRIQILSDRIVRLEKALNGTFCDGNTFFIPKRHIDGHTAYSVTAQENGNAVHIGGYTIFIPRGQKTLCGIEVKDEAGRLVYRCEKIGNTGELPPPESTPEIFAVADCPRIELPPCGYSEAKNGTFFAETEAEDLYLLFCCGDAVLLRSLYVSVTGQHGLVRLSALGLWDSRYYKYNEESAKERIVSYELHDVPLDYLVIDTDWRQSCDKGTGYDVNCKLFPDIKRFFSFAHEHNVEIMFNDHPEPLEGAESLLDEKEISFRSANLQKLLSLGLDTWWYDRNWQVCLKAPDWGIKSETWGMYAFSEITQNFYRVQDGQDYRRPDLMANISVVKNGTYLGISDSASHRYAIQWSGDIGSSQDSLSQEIATMIRCGNNCIPYVSSDCGGHQGNPNWEEYIRWMQFGAFSPILRPHCTKVVQRSREPWAYDERTLKIVRSFIEMRYHLLPLIYRYAFESYQCGMPIFRSLAFAYPKDAVAASCDSEYMLGNELLISPAIAREYVRIPKENYVEPVRAIYYRGTEWSGDPIYQTVYDDLFFHWADGEQPHPSVPATYYSAHYFTKLKFDRDIHFIVESDDFVIVQIDGETVYRDKGYHGAEKTWVALLKAGRIYDIDIQFYQGASAAAIALYMSEAVLTQKIYLPAGEWIDVFDGEIYRGERELRKIYPIEAMPVFVRSGALIPFAFSAKNTKEQDWGKIIYDYFPSRTEQAQGYLYEDDGATTAYLRGCYMKTCYTADWSEETKAYRLVFDAARGTFSGSRVCNVRTVTVRLHLRKGDTIGNVLLNREPIVYRIVKKDRCAMPFCVETSSPDADCIVCTFEQDISKEAVLEFCMNEIC